MDCRFKIAGVQIDEKHKNAKFSPCALSLEPYASLDSDF